MLWDIRDLNRWEKLDFILTELWITTRAFFLLGKSHVYFASMAQWLDHLDHRDIKFFIETRPHIIELQNGKEAKCWIFCVKGAFAHFGPKIPWNFHYKSSMMMNIQEYMKHEKSLTDTQSKINSSKSISKISRSTLQSKWGTTCVYLKTTSTKFLNWKYSQGDWIRR